MPVFQPVKTTLPHANASAAAGQSWHGAAVSAAKGHPFRYTSVSSGPAPGANDLNLASTQANILASSLGGFHDLTIVVGGTKQVVSLGSKLTGGEAVAAAQVLSSGRQTVKLAADGEAIGGSIALNKSLYSTLDDALGGSIGTLTISHGVKLIDSLSLLSLNGALDNDGSIVTAAATPHASDTISAGSIVNAAGGVIATYAGGSTGGGAGSGVGVGSGALFSADPVLNATTSVTNNGTISSAGNLTINAPVLNNIATVNGNTPSIIARDNVNITSQMLTNSGLIASSTANVNAGNGQGASFTLLNSGGTIKALNGNINLTTTNAAINASGGDLLSRQFNLKAQEGEVDVSADNISGVINASGDSVHVVTIQSQTLGNIDTSGDPGFVVLAGNLTVDGTITPTNGADLALIAGGNVLSGTKGVINTSTTAGGNGGNLTVIAGANVSGSDASAVVASGAGQRHRRHHRPDRQKWWHRGNHSHYNSWYGRHR